MHMILDDDCDSAAREANGWIDAVMNEHKQRIEVGARIVQPQLDELGLHRLTRALHAEFPAFDAFVRVAEDQDLVVWVLVPLMNTTDGSTELIHRLAGVIRRARIECILIGSTIPPTVH